MGPTPAARGQQGGLYTSTAPGSHSIRTVVQVVLDRSEPSRGGARHSYAWALAADPELPVQLRVCLVRFHLQQLQGVLGLGATTSGVVGSQAPGCRVRVRIHCHREVAGSGARRTISSGPRELAKGTLQAHSCQPPCAIASAVQLWQL